MHMSVRLLYRNQEIQVNNADYSYCYYVVLLNVVAFEIVVQCCCS